MVQTGFGIKSLEKTYSADVSITGIRLALNNRLPISQRRLECRVFIENQSFFVVAEIMWRAGKWMGTRFIAPSKDLQVAIALLLGSRIIHQSGLPGGKTATGRPRPSSSRLDETDLTEKWLSRGMKATDPHEKWIDRRSH